MSAMKEILQGLKGAFFPKKLSPENEATMLQVRMIRHNALQDSASIRRLWATGKIGTQEYKDRLKANELDANALVDQILGKH